MYLLLEKALRSAKWYQALEGYQLVAVLVPTGGLKRSPQDQRLVLVLSTGGLGPSRLEKYLMILRNLPEQR
jgi:hypothetical protein